MSQLPMPSVAPSYIGPAPFVYIDIASVDSVSDLVTVKLNGEKTVVFAQNGTLTIRGGILMSDAEEWIS